MKHISFSARILNDAVFSTLKNHKSMIQVLYVQSVTAIRFLHISINLYSSREAFTYTLAQVLIMNTSRVCTIALLYRIPHRTTRLSIFFHTVSSCNKIIRYRYCIPSVSAFSDTLTTLVSNQIQQFCAHVVKKHKILVFILDFSIVSNTFKRIKNEQIF